MVEDLRPPGLRADFLLPQSGGGEEKQRVETSFNTRLPVSDVVRSEKLGARVAIVRSSILSL